MTKKCVPTELNAILRCGVNKAGPCPELSDPKWWVNGITGLLSSCDVENSDDNAVCQTSPGNYRYYKWIPKSKCKKAQVVHNFKSGKCVKEDGTNSITYVIPPQTKVPHCDEKGSIYYDYDGGGKSSSSMIWIIVLIALLLVAGVIAYVVYSHKKQKKGGNSFNNSFYTQPHFSS